MRLLLNKVALTCHKCPPMREALRLTPLLSVTAFFPSINGFGSKTSHLVTCEINDVACLCSQSTRVFYVLTTNFYDN